LERGRRIAEVTSELGVSYKTAANSTSMLKTKLGASFLNQKFVAF